MKIISSEDRLPTGGFLTKGPSYGIGYNGATFRWMLVWRPRHGWRFAREHTSHE